MTRIGLVVHGQPPELVGGTERLVAELGAALAVRGDTVEIFSGSIEWRPEFEVVRDESGSVPIVRVHRHDLFFERWDKLENPFVERAFGKWLDGYKPDLVHVHHWARLSTRLVAVAAARGVPVVVTLHDLFSTCPRYHRVKADLSFCDVPPGPDACRNCAPRWRFQGDAEIDSSVSVFAADLRAEVAAANALIAPTTGHGQRVLHWLNLDRPVTAITPASTPATGAASRPLGNKTASSKRPLAVGVFGHLHPLKGVEVLLDAQAALPDPGVIEVHVWGAAPTPELDATIKTRAGGRRVVWHGAYQPADLSGAALDAVVLPTLCAESYSFALDEACALGVPVLASDLGALTDRATERLALFPRGDAAALATQLDSLASDPARRDAMAAAPAPALTDTERHLSELSAVYAALPPADYRLTPASADADLTRREHAFALREAGLNELLRSEGWEDEITRLQAEIARLSGP